jgi:murein DD-endopeptidase MepM/ murein hydrolase activator NlpD
MRQSWLFFGTALVAVTITVMVYKPVSVALFNLREPYFKSPIRTNNGKFVIRGDSFGNGEYGSKRSNNRAHTGIDILANVGTPVYASKSGIAFRLNVPTGYGKYVMIYHPDGMQTLYAHLSEWNIDSPAIVRQGQVIGFVGKTGNAFYLSIQPHLHFEIRKNGKPQDPKKWMR